MSIKDPFEQLEQWLTASYAKSKWQLASALIDIQVSATGSPPL
jgi:hypothetical protein